MILILIAIPADANFWNGYALNGSVLVGYVLKIRIGGICIGGIRLRFLLMHTFWMDTHWMDTHSMDTYWWDTCWTDTYWWDTYWWDTYCKTCWCKRFEWIRIAWIRTGGIRVERIRIGGIRFEWICVVWWICVGYVWCEICVGYVWCEIRQQSSEEPCDETSFGKNDHAYLFIALAVFSCSTNVGKQVFERNSSVTTCQCVTILYQETGDQVGYIGPLMTSGIRRQRTKQILSLSRWEKENTKIRVIQSGNQWVMLFVENDRHFTWHQGWFFKADDASNDYHFFTLWAEVT